MPTAVSASQPWVPGTHPTQVGWGYLIQAGLLAREGECESKRERDALHPHVFQEVGDAVDNVVEELGVQSQKEKLPSQQEAQQDPACLTHSQQGFKQTRMLLSKPKPAPFHPLPHHHGCIPVIPPCRSHPAPRRDGGDQLGITTISNL